MMMSFGKPSITSSESFGFRGHTTIYGAEQQPTEDPKPTTITRKFNGVHGLTDLCDPSANVDPPERKKKVYKPCERLLKRLAREHESTS